jgi:transcriptional regulator with XRE-family HTH domain
VGRRPVPSPFIVPPRDEAALRVAIAQRVAALRQARGYTISDIARALGVALSSYTKYERGGGLTHTRLVQVADVLGVTVDVLIGDGRFDEATAAEEAKRLRDAVGRLIGEIERGGIAVTDEAADDAVENLRAAWQTCALPA